MILIYKNFFSKQGHTYTCHKIVRFSKHLNTAHKSNGLNFVRMSMRRGRGIKIFATDKLRFIFLLLLQSVVMPKFTTVVKGMMVLCIWLHATKRRRFRPHVYYAEGYRIIIWIHVCMSICPTTIPIENGQNRFIFGYSFHIY